MNAPVVSLEAVGEEYASRAMELFEKVKGGEVNLGEAIECVMAAVTEAVVDLMSEDEFNERFPQVTEAMPAIMIAMSGFAEKEFFVRLVGLEAPVVVKARMEMFPRLVEFTSASDKDLEDLPGIDINVSILPPILDGRLLSFIRDGDYLYALEILTDKVKYYNLPIVFEWSDGLDGALDISDYKALLALGDGELGSRILERIIPALDNALEKLGV